MSWKSCDDDGIFVHNSRDEMFAAKPVCKLCTRSESHKHHTGALEGALNSATLSVLGLELTYMMIAVDQVYPLAEKGHSISYAEQSAAISQSCSPWTTRHYRCGRA